MAAPRGRIGGGGTVSSLLRANSGRPRPIRRGFLQGCPDTYSWWEGRVGGAEVILSLFRPPLKFSFSNPSELLQGCPDTYSWKSETNHETLTPNPGVSPFLELVE
jgi:hypothetical protein